MSIALAGVRSALLPGMWARNDLWRRARAMPTFDFDFAGTKSMVDLVSGGRPAAFSRVGSSGTYVDSDGLIKTAAADVPRFDHDPVTGACRGLLIESTRSNLLLHNRTLTNAVWTANNITAVKNQVGADGVNNSASLITATTNNGTILQSITAASSTYITSAYVKRIAGSGVVEMTQNGGTTWTAITVTSSWFRVSIPTATLTNPAIGFRLATSGDAIAVDYVQCVAGMYLSSVIESNASQVLRYADTAGLDALPSIYNQAAGTFVVRYQRNAFGDIPSNQYPAIIYTYGTTGGLLVFADGTNENVKNEQASIQYGHAADFTRQQVLAISYSPYGFQSSLNGSPVISRTNPIGTGITNIAFGQVQAETSNTIARLTYFPTALSSDLLQELTR